MLEVHAIVVSHHDPTNVLLNYFSTWNKLRRAVAWFLKLKSLLTQCAPKRKRTLKAVTADPMTLFVQDPRDRRSHCEVLPKSRILAGDGKSAQWKECQPEKLNLQTGSIL